MDNLKKNKNIIIFCIIIVVIVSVIVFLDYIGVFNKEAKSEEYLKEPTIEKYDANVFIPVYMTEDGVVKIYLNEYKNNMIFNVEEAYNSLNESYRNKKFGSLEKYKEYVNTWLSSSTYSMEVDKYSVTNIKGNKVFNVYDKSGNQYIFKEFSIMNYEVYLDQYTVTIN